MKNLNALIAQIQISKVINPSDNEIRTIEFDSRKVKEGSLFVAIEGSALDGHLFIDRAIEKGACCIVCERFEGRESVLKNCTVIITDNSRLALARLAHAFFDFPSGRLNVTGITGTNGKTTITFLLNSIYEKTVRKPAIIGTTGIYYGGKSFSATHTTPDPLQLCTYFETMRAKGITDLVMEVSSHALAQYRADGISFHSAIFTNLTHEHLDYHKTPEEYAKAKKRLFEMLSPDGIAIVNGDDKYGDFMLEGCRSELKFKLGRSQDNDIRITDEKFDLNGISFSIRFGNQLPKKLQGIIKINSLLTGKFNIENLSFAAAIARLQGIDCDIISQALAKAQGAPGRMQRVMLKSGALALVDYAHTPDALEKALSTCREILESSDKPNARLICVFGCGGDRDSSKRPVMGEISGRIADFTVITNDNPRTEDPDKIIAQIYAGISKENKIKTIMISDRSDAVKYAAKLAVEGDILLVAGKGHENYQIIGTEKIHFDDREELEKY
ncbi:MAG: UDP-N-acetylmuramoyl-L-alanyl-D-glutamate--2,6-diaminopimelate ligase [Bacteroidota bacterium]|nr:UDP-N-acetylmuramoyl-L-alanyl-D-glutamate--2,6-diaminopimelate ligase [Bacteroidota bacterium]